MTFPILKYERRLAKNPAEWLMASVRILPPSSCFCANDGALRSEWNWNLWLSPSRRSVTLSWRAGNERRWISIESWRDSSSLMIETQIELCPNSELVINSSFLTSHICYVCGCGWKEEFLQTLHVLWVEFETKERTARPLTTRAQATIGHKLANLRHRIKKQIQLILKGAWSGSWKRRERLDENGPSKENLETDVQQQVEAKKSSTWGRHQIQYREISRTQALGSE